MYDRTEARSRIECFTQFIRNKLSLLSPVDMLQVCHDLGVVCKKVSDVDYDAMITYDNNLRSVSINYNTDRIPERIQFSVAHELGHLFLHMLQKDGSINEYREYYRRNGDANRIEYEANEFAASLLMPRDEFLSACMKHLDNNNNVDLEKVAKHFNVSRQAASVRGSVLDVW